MSWYSFDNGKSVGQRGSENGIMIHTRFFDPESEAQGEFERMKAEGTHII